MLALFALATPRQAVLAALDDMEHELALIGYERMMKTAKAATTGGDGTPVFDTDEAAAEHFAATEPSRLTNVQVLFSFGTRDDGSKAEDAARSGFQRVKTAVEFVNHYFRTGSVGGNGLGFGSDNAYVDLVALNGLNGAYKKAGHPMILNVFWKQYYQDAMRQADYMFFVITEGWLLSPNSWDELEWAAGESGGKAGIRDAYGGAARIGKTNIMLLLDQKAQDAYNGRPCESWMSGDVGGHKGLDKVSRTGELKRLFDQLDGQVVPLRAIASRSSGAKLSGTELADIVKHHLPKL